MARLTDLADQQDILGAFNAALGKVKERAVRALHSNARKAQKKLHDLFEREKFATVTRRTKKLGAYGSRWRKRKAQLGYDLRRGHASGRMSRAINATSAIRRNDEGFDLDIKASAAQTRAAAPRRISRRRSRNKKPRAQSNVAAYLKYYERQKAPGLGTLPKSAVNLLQKAVDRATVKQLTRIRQSARRPGQEFFVDINIELGGLEVL